MDPAGSERSGVNGAEQAVYLVVYDRGGIGWAGTDEQAAHEHARATESVVARLPIVADYRTADTP